MKDPNSKHTVFWHTVFILSCWPLLVIRSCESYEVVKVCLRICIYKYNLYIIVHPICGKYLSPGNSKCKILYRNANFIHSQHVSTCVILCMHMHFVLDYKYTIPDRPTVIDSLKSLYKHTSIFSRCVKPPNSKHKLLQSQIGDHLGFPHQRGSLDGSWIPSFHQLDDCMSSSLRLFQNSL